MNIVIVGFGKFSKELTKRLLTENHNVVVIDNDAEVINDAVSKYDVKGFIGNGASIDTLKDAEVNHFDLLVALTSYDEVNILSCLVAKKLGIKETIARVRSIEYIDQSRFLMKDLGISLVLNSDLICAEEIYNIIRFPKAIQVETFSNNKTALIEIKIDGESSIFKDLKLSEIKNKVDSTILVCCVLRDDEVIIPKGDFTVQEGDIIYISVNKKEIAKTFKKFKIYQNKITTAMIIGGGRLSYYLASMLIESGFNVKIIEKDKEISQKLNELLPEAIILNADGTNQDLLIEEGINHNAVITLTGFDETNILISSFAKNNESPKVITKISNASYETIIDNLGLDTIVSPKESFVEDVIRFIRKIENNRSSECESLHFLLDSKVEALEFKVSNETKYTNRPIKELEISKDTLIAAIIKDQEVLIPSGDDLIEVGDEVIIISKEPNIIDLSQVLK